MQADESPARSVDSKHRTQLVPETERLKDLPIAGAARHDPAGGSEQRLDAVFVARDVGPLVDVIGDKFVLYEEGFGGRRDLLLIRSGEEQRRRINRGPPDAVRRDR